MMTTATITTTAKNEARGWRLSALSLSRSIRNKLVVVLLVFGIVPALAALGAFLWERPMFEKMLNESFSRTAETMLDVIDRNLFERYGDVQSLGLNALAIDPANWRKPEAGNPLVTAMDAYTRNYGIYKLMLLVDPTGQVLAVNSMDASARRSPPVPCTSSPIRTPPGSRRRWPASSSSAATGSPARSSKGRRPMRTSPPSTARTATS
jgi:hypothetical protein